MSGKKSFTVQGYVKRAPAHNLSLDLTMKRFVCTLIAASLLAAPAGGYTAETKTGRDTGRGASASATAAADVFPWAVFLATLLVIGGTAAIILTSNSSSPPSYSD